jgi:DNA-directed RNA polymerase subunit beta'
VKFFLQNIKLKEKIDSQGAITKTSKTAGLIWVLYGERYVLNNSSKIDFKVGQKLLQNNELACQKVINNYSGIINFDNLATTREINVINSSVILENGILSKESEIFTLTLTGTKKVFQLTVKKNESIKHGQTIAYLKEDSYKTKTGGIIYYSTAYSENKKKRNTRKLFTGFLYWVPEETHILTSLIMEKIKVKNGSFVSKGTTLLPNVFAKIDGFVHIDYDNYELIIKPGELYQISTPLKIKISKCNRFVKPGELLFSNIVVQKLSFLEFVTFQGLEYILLRPVITYKVPQEKGFYLKYCFFPNINNRSVAFRTVKRVFYKDGEKIKSSKSVDLLKTFLVLDIRSKYTDLDSKIEIIPLDTSIPVQKYGLRLNLYEKIKIPEFGLKNANFNERVLLKKAIRNNQYAIPKTKIAKTKLLTNASGILSSVNRTNNLELLILKENFIKKCIIDTNIKSVFVKKGDLVRIGTYLTPNDRSKYAGQIYKIEKGLIFIRLGQPHLISEGTILRTANQSLVDRSDILATLVYEKLKTVDIVQGLPKVEEILEARKVKNGCLLSPSSGQIYIRNKKIEIIKSSSNKLFIGIESQMKINFNNGDYVKFLEPLTDGPINPHDKLETLFNHYKLGFPIHEACKKSFKHLQLFLVNEVQRTYLSQGVQIADKHIEIIVKQMTSKVRVYNGENTTLLPGEILEINQAELITKVAISSGEKPPIYKPMLLGLTKASLNSDSFISAASFQETTRVLTEAAIEGKKDWLNGLKENVIIGRLIPAGTGFNNFENLKKVSNKKAMNLLINSSSNTKLKTDVLKVRIN